ncbi:helix-turn-helix domain-containing protein [Synechococcus sp. C9]|uniref:helix-turn-helix domain-containing protein n=2 Tax=Synechococcus sp. C9 TaxID=102119 RepID=UPI001FF27133
MRDTTEKVRMLTCTKPEMVALLGEFIRSTSDARELKRALAVRMAIEGKPYGEITELLKIHKSFITRWKQEFYEKGIEGLKLGYHGKKVIYQKQKNRKSLPGYKQKIIGI